jgi:hypothetical protein
MGEEIILLSRKDRVLSEPMLLDLQIAISEIEKRLDTLDIGYQKSEIEKSSIKIIQDIKASCAAEKRNVINNIMINNIDMKSFTFLQEIRGILSLLKEKLKYCETAESNKKEIIT